MDTADGRELVEASTLIATDGGGSAVRQALMKRRGVKVQEDILPHAYKELTIPAGPAGTHQMDREALHIWPRGGYMLIALPNLDGSFTLTPVPGPGRRAQLRHPVDPRSAASVLRRELPGCTQADTGPGAGVLCPSHGSHGYRARGFLA